MITTPLKQVQSFILTIKNSHYQKAAFYPLCLILSSVVLEGSQKYKKKSFRQTDGRKDDEQYVAIRANFNLKWALSKEGKKKKVQSNQIIWII